MRSQLIRALALLVATFGLITFNQTASHAIVDRDCSDFDTQACSCEVVVPG